MPLPRTFALMSKHNDKYLRQIIEDTQLYGLLKFSGDESLTACSMFHVEMASTDDGLVNIRSFYNDKYWVSRQLANDEYYFVAAADEPNENQSSESCTLFQPSPIDDDPSAIRLRHVHLQKYVSMSKASSRFPSCSFAGSADPDPDRFDVLQVTPTDPHSTPVRVNFMGDNGNYITVYKIEKSPYLKFSSKHTQDLSTWFEIFPLRNQTIRIKSISNDAFWRCSSAKWILVDASNNDPETLFQYTNYKDPKKHKLAVKSGIFYCQRHDEPKDHNSDQKKDCLIANATKITEEAVLQINECISSRSIFNFVLNPREARFHHKTKLEEVASETAINHSDEELAMEFNLQYCHPVTKIWSSRISKKIFDTFKIFAKVALPLNGEMEIVDEPEQDYTWGEPITVEEEEIFHFVAAVPPKSKVKVRLTAVKGTVDVPFTYDQQDNLLDGQLVTLHFDDGVCSVTKFLELFGEPEFEPLVQ